MPLELVAWIAVFETGTPAESIDQILLEDQSEPKKQRQARSDWGTG